ncbi:PH domain-containing protein [Nafulsella turpanensis]|uniref:hypothetical protein n=1 Tax=Nafulsella turpanensis TaxID=1265690 RepID=UPI0003653AEA|nr:hypothetical protein [Nafulsella turpanensis]
MDLGSVIIALVLLALCIVPFIYYSGVQKKKKKNFSKELINLAEQQNVKFSQYEVWSHYYGIGIDTSTNRLFYFKKREDKEQKAFIDLSEVEKCRVNNVNRMVNDNKIIDRLELVFKFRDSKMPEKALEFYNKEESMSLHEELQLSEKWANIINSNLKPAVSKP